MNICTFRPAYLLRRLNQMWFQRRFPDAPWLTQSAVLLLSSYLKRSDIGFEWGSGRSTIWFARRVRHLTSIEHNAEWFERVRRRLTKLALADRVNYLKIPCDLGEMDEPVEHSYVEPARQLADESLDFALVDGSIRSLCTHVILPKIKPGGLVILDNANRFLPNIYGRGFSTIHEPRSTPRTEKWAALLQVLEAWRAIQTSDGIWDTRFWIKPCH